MIPQPQQPHYEEQPQYYPPQMYTPEGQVDNIVEQINPQQIIDNFDHALRGEYYNKEKGMWELNASKEAMVNDSCRGALISFLTGILNNASTMGIIDKNQLGSLMEAVIESINRMFVVNLEKYGFVPIISTNDEFENKGTPDSAKMTMVANMVYSIAFLVYTRSLNGMESRKIFSSLSMTDALNNQQQQQHQGWTSRIFGG